MPSATRRSAAVTLGITAVLAASLTGCAAEEEQPDQVAVCVDQQTQERVADEQCDPDQTYRGTGVLAGAFAWYYLGRATAFPPVGARVGGGTFATPTGSSWARGGVPAQGGQVRAGGFGGASKSGGVRAGTGGGLGGGFGGGFGG